MATPQSTSDEEITEISDGDDGNETPENKDRGHFSNPDGDAVGDE